MKKKWKPVHKNSIIRRILFPMLLVIILQTVCIMGILTQSGIVSHLKDNSTDILQERVNSRKTYLETTMVNNWSKVDGTVRAVNQKTQAYLEKNALELSDLGEMNEQNALFLNTLSDDLITMLRNNRVTGAFLILNTSDLSQETANGGFTNKLGLYFRDLDPKSEAANNSDLLLERGSSLAVRDLGIATSSYWEPGFNFSDSEKYQPFFYEPYQNAYANLKNNLDTKLSDWGYWSPSYQLSREDTQAISYSVPLFLEDGSLYGVLGVDITLDYLKTMLPYSELASEKEGSYLLAIGNPTTLEFQNVMTNGPALPQVLGDSVHYTARQSSSGGQDEYYLESQDNEMYCTIQYLNLYNSNVAFSSQRWALIGTVAADNLFSFAHTMQNLLRFCIILTFLIGIGIAVLITYLISRPVLALSQEMEEADPHKALKLKRTRIMEIDQLSNSLEKLSRDVIHSANKFTRIMEMASARLAGFEFDRQEKSLFVTEKFFDIFSMYGIDESSLSQEEFFTYMKTLRRYYQADESHDNEYVFKIRNSKGNSYVRLTLNDNGKHCYGLAEDVTRMIQERQIIEHERDYDLLTGLINRRAFHRQMTELFEHNTASLKLAVLLMMDLDNLKQINDGYGHDCGDKYIQIAADTLKKYTPEKTIISRISGDEFYLFFYGYETRQDVLNQIHHLEQGINATVCHLPGGHVCPLHISGGYAWYPKDSENFSDLLRFSDFAMYRVKQNQKGLIEGFDQEIYKSESYLIQNKAELTRLIDEQAVYFCFQPIVDAKTGGIHGYEALMRSFIPTLHSPLDILRLARMEHKLNQIETLTWFKALEAFSAYLKNGAVTKDCKLFVNSIADQIINMDKMNELLARYHDLFSQVVMEVTEEQRMNRELREIKTRIMHTYNSKIALDDFGSGYNSEKNLLELEPDYVKVDISIIRDIDRELNKQILFKNIVTYAHKDGMKVIAEGVETYAELKAAIDLGVDYLQGFYLSRPEKEPLPLSEEVRNAIKKANEDN